MSWDTHNSTSLADAPEGIKEAMRRMTSRGEVVSGDIDDDEDDGLISAG